MKATLFEEQTFKGIDFSGKALPKGKYDTCSFVNCIFAQSDLSHLNFVDCTFDACDFSMARLDGTGLKEVRFVQCKLLGVYFHHCEAFLLAMDFENCQLDLASFAGLQLKETEFRHCSLQETDFSETNLTSALFDHCDLSRAIFSHSILEKADFRTAQHYSIDPEFNRIKKARFSFPDVLGLLEKYQIEVNPLD